MIHANTTPNLAVNFPVLSPAIIAIDGPAASGKSTIGFKLAGLINYLFFDTGIMYRAVTWAVLAADILPSSFERVGHVARNTQINILPPTGEDKDGRQNSVVIQDIDITWQLRTPEIDQNVSLIAANPEVRDALSAQQRQIALDYGQGHLAKPGIIMVGRDIGTVVVPDAPLKIYLSASAEARAQRRYLEQSQRSEALPYAQVLEDISKRDQLDSQRTHAPLRAADDALKIDTSHMTIDEVVERIIELAHEAV